MAAAEADTASVDSDVTVVQHVTGDGDGAPSDVSAPSHAMPMPRD